jgi:hypothetical protein
MQEKGKTMKNISLQLRNAFLAAFAVLALAPFAAFGQNFKYDSDPEFKDLAETPEIYGPKIAGVWKTEVRITVCATGNTVATFESMGLFGADGTFLDTNTQNPSTKSSSFGYWDHVRANQYKFVSRWFRFAPDGTYLGTSVVRHDLVMALDGETYESAGTGTMYDQAGNVQFVGCSEASAERFR